MKVRKRLQGNHGIKRFDPIKLALNCSDISTISEEGLIKFRGDIVALRQKARSQVSARSGALITQLERVDDIPHFRTELATLRVSLPKEMKQRLGSLVG